MRYGEVLPAEFIARPNRFIAHVRLRGEEVVCHVKNTGRCRELLQSGVQVWLERGTNPRRKTAYDLIAVRKGERLVNMDAQAPNKIFGEWAMCLEPGILSVKPEVFFEDSRLDSCWKRRRGATTWRSRASPWRVVAMRASPMRPRSGACGIYIR